MINQSIITLTTQLEIAIANLNDSRTGENPSVRDEFQELAQDDMLAQIIKHGLLRIQRNNEQDAVVIRTLEQAESTRLKNMDVISRVVHWHEPPVHIPNGNICVERIDLPELVLKAAARSAVKNRHLSTLKPPRNFERKLLLVNSTDLVPTSTVRIWHPRK